jgi:competence protein ComGA
VVLLSIIEQKSDAIISRAVQEKASDVHIVPSHEVSLVQLRIGTHLLPLEKIRNSDAEKLISHFKFRSKMDIGERRRPQNGSLTLIVRDKQINLRISTLPTFPHESLAIRVLPQNEVATLDELSLYKSQTAQLRTLMKKAHGLLLISGPTGSGKTTTIYSLLYDQYSKDRRIITIEDPIEKKTDAFIQVEINEKAGLTYGEALKATLRHDPDIIMIGEIRDPETAKIAIRAAMTGHLVLSTIHSNDTKGCISRLREFGCAEIDIKETLIGLVSQRLVGLSCPYCGDQCTIHCLVKQEKRRLAVYEILAGSPLNAVLSNSNMKVNYPKLGQLINKGIALGFVREAEYERWLC